MGPVVSFSLPPRLLGSRTPRPMVSEMFSRAGRGGRRGLACCAPGTYPGENATSRLCLWPSPASLIQSLYVRRELVNTFVEILQKKMGAEAPIFSACCQAVAVFVLRKLCRHILQIGLKLVQVFCFRIFQNHRQMIQNIWPLPDKATYRNGPVRE